MAKATYIEHDLEWLESTFNEWKELIDSFKPFTSIDDRTVTEPNAKGIPMTKTIAKKEDTIKTIGGILKELPSLLQAINELRKEKAEAQVEVRGGSAMNRMFEKALENKEE